MSTLITFEPDVVPGTEESQPDGTVLRYVEPEEYYVALLGQRMNASLVFLSAMVSGKIEQERLLAVDEAIAHAYWNEYLGCLMPARIMEALSRAAIGPSGALLMDSLESCRKELFAAQSMEEALEVHAGFRVQMLIQGTDGFLTDLQTSVGELLVDILCLQRATAEDIRRAERQRKRDEPRAALLHRWDRTGKLEYERAMGHVLRPGALLAQIPRNRMEDVKTFARTRRPFFHDGILINLEGALEEADDFEL